MEKCKRCASKTKLSDEDIAKMVCEVRGMRGVKTVDEQEYSRRLKCCAECDKFEYGSTCTLCGCIMQVRALLTTGKCPYPKNPKW